MSNLRLESTSARVLNYIKENPGIHLRKIKVGLNISMGSIQYQLALLERKGKIASTRRGLYKFYFPSGVFHNTEKEILQALSSQSTREMLVFIIEQEYPTQTDIASHLQMSAVSINWHAKRLIELQIIHTIKDKKYIRYFVDNNHRFFIVSLLKNYYPSVWEQWSSRLGEIFLNLSNHDNTSKINNGQRR